MRDGVESTGFDPETVSLLRTVLDDAWGSLAPNAQAQTSLSVLASRILDAAHHGERDPDRLKAAAIMHFVSLQGQA